MKSEDWHKKLSPKQYYILREKGTEPAFSGKLLHNKRQGNYTCVACGAELFKSDTKFDSGSGWPSFYDAATKSAVILQEDGSSGIHRVEVTCASCGSHLGHVFSDAPKTPTGQRYCINSTSLEFKPKN